MKKTCIFLVAFVLVLVMTGIPHALCYPPAGFDYMDPTTATIELEISGMFNETITVKGPTVVSRSDPYDPGDGRFKIDTEIVSMDLVGTSVNIGPITIIESPTKSSSGFIQQQTAGQDFPADSFFDVFVEIQTTLPFPLSILHNDDPVPMEATIYEIRPWGSLYISPPVNIILRNELDIIIGFIKHVSHKIRMQGDINGDGIIDIFDIVLCALAFGSRPGDPDWDERADIWPQPGGDNLIDIFDIVIIGKHYGETGC